MAEAVKIIVSSGSGEILSLIAVIVRSYCLTPTPRLIWITASGTMLRVGLTVKSLPVGLLGGVAVLSRLKVRLTVNAAESIRLIVNFATLPLAGSS